ncbi:MAG: cyclic nucleotide-binding domain-containing protein [Deltaproteobacteria bacterium]|nr:cyclic nucleotide-binding domain-containing protein [Deltaproteobacteria bacterium]
MLGDNISREIIDFFINMPIFDRINAEEIKVVARHMNTIELGPDEILFRESDKGNYVFFIREGELDVLKKSEASGADVILATLGKGQSIGEMSIIDDSPRSATIRAISHTVLYILSKSAFDLILSKHPKIGIKLLKGISFLLSSNLRDTSKRLADYIPPLT